MFRLNNDGKCDLNKHNLNIDLLNFFSYYGLKVPTTEEEAKISVEELEKKKKHWESLDVRESGENEDEKRTKKHDGSNKSVDLSLNPVNFPAPEDSKEQEKYGIFKDEGPVPPASNGEIRGKRGKRRFR